MSIFPNKPFVAIFLSLLLLPPIDSLEARGTAPSAVSTATGGSASLFLNDAASLIWNPAASAVERYSQITVAFHEPYALNYWGATAFIPPAGTIGFSYYATEAAPIQEKQLGVSFARPLQKGFFLGGSLAAVRQSEAESLLGRIGGLYAPGFRATNRSVSLSPFYRLFLQKIRFAASFSRTKNAYEFSGGIAYQLPYDKVTLFFSSRRQSHWQSDQAGLSWDIRRFLTAYAGFEMGRNRLYYGLAWCNDPLTVEAGFDSRTQRWVLSTSLRTGDDPKTAAEKHYQRAKEALRLHLRKDALHQARRALYFEEHHAGAQALLEGVKSIVAEEDRLIDSLAALALRRLAEKQTLEAALLLNEATKIDPSHHGLHKHLAVLSAAAKPEIEMWFQRAVELYEASEPDMARHIFEAIRLIDPKHPQAAYYIQKFKEKDAEEAERHYLAGLECLSRKEIYSAEEEFLTTLKLQPMHAEAYEQLANLRLHKKMNLRAVSALLEEAAEKEKRRDWQGALSAYQQVLELEKDHPIVAEKTEEIRRIIEEEIEAHLRRGADALQRGDTLQARTSFEAVLAYDSNHIKAKDFLARLNEPAGDRSQFLLRQAKAAFSAKKFELAAVLADSSLKINPRAKEAELLLDRIRRQVQAETLLHNAKLQLQRHDLAAALQSAHAAWILKPNAAAQEVLNSCRIAVRREVDELFNLGMTHYATGEYRQAVKWWDEVLRLSPGHKGAQEYRARAAERLEALETIR